MADLTDSDWDEILANRRGATTAKGLLTSPDKVDPDKAAQAAKIGKDMNISPLLIEGDEDKWAKDILEARNKRLVEGNPELNRYVSKDPMNGRVSYDDLDSIATAQKALKDFGRMVTPFFLDLATKPKETISTAAASAGRKMLEFASDPFGLMEPTFEEVARIENQRRVQQWMAGDLSVIPEIEKYEADQKLRQSLTTDENRANIFQEVFGQFAGQMVGSAKAGIRGATAGALGGLAATAPAGGIGAIPGAIGGFAGGILLDQMMLAGSSGFRELDVMRGPNGEKISEEVKWAAAAAIGLTTGAFEGMQLNVLYKIASTAMKRILADKVAHTSITSMISYAVGQGIQGGAIEVGQGIAEDLSKQMAIIISDIGVDNLKTAPRETLEMIGNNVADNFKAGFILSGSLGLAGASMRRGNPVGDSVAVQRAKNSQARLDLIMDMSAENKTRKRLPEKWEDALKESQFELPLQIPLEVAENHREQLGWIPALDEKIAEARATGSEIEFDLSKLAAYGNDIYPLIKNDIRIGPMGVTPTEAGAPSPAPLPPAAPAAVPTQTGGQAIDIPGDAQTVIQKLFGRGRTFPTAEQATEAITATSIARVMRGIRAPEAAPAQATPTPGVVVPPAEALVPGTPGVPPAPVLSAPKPGPQPISKATVIRGQDYRPTDPNKPVNLEAVANDITAKVQAALANGGAVVYHVEGKPVQIVAVDRGMMADAQGQRWGVLPLLSSTPGKRTEIEITPTQATIPVGEAPQMPTALSSGTSSILVPASKSATQAVFDGKPKHIAGDAPLTDAQLIEAIGFDDPKTIEKITETIAQLDPTFIEAIVTKDETGTIAGAVARRPQSLKELYNAIREESVSRGQDPRDAIAVVDAALNMRVAMEVRAAGMALINGIENETVRNAVLQASRRADDQRSAMWLTPKIEDPKAIGMTKRDFALYSKKIMQQQKKITKDMFDFAYKLLAKMETDTWKARAAEMGPDVREAVSNRPELAAYEMLMTGKKPFDVSEEHQAYAKLNKEEVDALFTKDELKELGVKGKLSDHLPSRMFASVQESLPLNEATKWFGFQTGKEMMTDLANVQTELIKSKESRQTMYKRVASEELNARMIQQYGDLNESITRGAMEMAMDRAPMEVLAAEIKALSGDGQLKVGDIENDINRTIAQMTVKDSSKMEKYQNLAGKYGREAHTALLRGDITTALQAQQLQYKQMLLAHAAKDIREEVRQTQNLINRYTHKERREVRSVDMDTRFRQLLELTGLRTGRNEDAQARAVAASGPVDWREWRQEHYQNTGIDLPEPQYLSDPNFKPDELDKMRTADFRGFGLTLRAMDRAGRDAQFLKSLKGEIELKLFVKTVAKAQEWRENAQRYLSSDLAQTVSERLRQQGRHWDAQMLKVESLVDFLDKFDPVGPVNTFFFNPLKMSDKVDRDLRVKYAAMMKKLNHGETFESLHHAIENKMWLDPTGKPMNLTRNNMIAIALNWGNEGNRKALINGFLAAGHRLDQLAIDEILMNPKNMTKENWEFVKGIWKVFDDLMPEVDGVRYRTMGVPNKRRPNTQFMNGFGEMVDGGFYPIMESAAAHNRLLPQEQGLVDPGQYNRLPKTDWLDEKISNNQPLRLDLAWMVHNTERIIHAVAYTESLINANKVVNNKQFMDTIKASYGIEYAELLPRWLKYIANKGGSYDSAVAQGYDSLMKGLSKNAVSTMVGFNVPVAIIHSGSAAVNTFGELGKNSFKAILAVVKDTVVLQTIDWIFRNPTNMNLAHNEAQLKSLDMRARIFQREADMQAAIDRFSQISAMGKYATIKYNFNVWAQGILSTTDYASALVGWTGAYRQSKEAGYSEQESIAIADKLVRSAHGGRSSLLDMAEVQRKENLFAWTRFYGYFNHNYNQLRKKTVEAEIEFNKNRADKNIIDSTLSMGNMWERHFWKSFWVMTMYNVVPAMIHALVRENLPDPEEEDPIGSMAWWAKKALISQTGALLPIIRDFTFAVEHPQFRSSLPAWAAVNTVQDFSKDLRKAWDDDEKIPKRPIEHGLAAAGFLFGMPSKTFAKWMQVIYDINSENGNRESPDGYEEWLKTMLYGEPVPPGTKKKH